MTTVNELIKHLQSISELGHNVPVMLEVERDICFNLQQVKMGSKSKFVILSIVPDPFEDALKKAGVP
jgi:hypothetical protein